MTSKDSTASSGDAPAIAWFENGGDMGALMRSVDWSQTVFGPVARWPQSLRTAISIMLESRFAMVVAWGPEFRFFYNDRYRPVLGKTKHPAALGAAAAEIFPEVWPAVGPAFEGVRRGEAFAIDDWLLPLERNGYLENCWFTLSYSPIRDETGGVGGLLAVVAETTGRVEGERRLATLRELARRASGAKAAEQACVNAAQVFETNPIDVPFSLIYLLDRDGTIARRVCSTGIAADHPANIAHVEFGAGTPEDNQDLWSLEAVVRSGHTVVVSELDPRVGALPGGPYDEPTHTVILLPLSRPGLDHPYGVVVAGVSPRRAMDDRYRDFFELAADHIATAVNNAATLEDARRRAEALAELDRAKTAFFSNVSHEFRTPLTLMLGPLEDILAKPDTIDRDGHRDLLAVVHRNGVRLLKLVNNLLDFSRIEAGRTDAVYEPLDLAAYTADLASNFQSATERVGLGFVIECAPLAQPVYVDREMWEKIVLNLLSNALKFTFEGEIAVKVRGHHDRVELTVADSGTGIAETDLPHIFQRFHRVRGARSRTQEGTGIGLALVQELVRLHGGTIRASSIAGEGTTFTVSVPTGTAHLPAARIGASRGLSPTAARTDAYVNEALGWLPDAHHDLEHDTTSAALTLGDSGARILLADDNADMRAYVRQLLSPHWQVEAVSDGATALARARDTRPDLIISDVMMPGLDGFALLHALRSQPSTREIPVMLLSARAGEEATIQGVEAGADDYLVKPFTARQLIARAAAQVARSRARAVVEAQRAQLYDLFMQAPAPICVFRGPELVFEMANALYLQIAGGKDLVGRPFLEAMPELAGLGYDDVLRKVLQTGQSQYGTELLFRLDRHGHGRLEDTYWTFVYAPMRNSDGIVDRVMAFFNEVTDQVRARQEVEALAAATREREWRYRRIFESSGVSIWDEDYTAVKNAIEGLRSAGVRDFRQYFADHPEFVERCIASVAITDVNEESLRMFRAENKQELSQSLANVFDAQTREVFVGSLVAIAEGQPRFEAEAVLKTLRGERLQTLVSITFPPSGGPFASVLVTITDITPLKAAEDALREQMDVREGLYRELQDANRVKDEFLATLSHELRTPLNGMLGWSHMLRSGSLRPEMQQRALDSLERNARMQVQLVDDLLDVSRIISGKLQIQPEEVDLAQVVLAALDTVRPAADAKGVSVKVAIDPETEILVTGESERLQQVVWNLLSNSIKFTPAGGRVDVELRHADSGAEIVVKDTGQGITPGFLPYVFERFRQADGTVTRRHGGLGLGLAIVRHLTEAHGGVISAESPGADLGATFVVRLPIRAVRTRRRPQPSMLEEPKAPVLTDARILVVDDEADARDLVRTALEQCGARVTTVASADEALHALGHQAFDVLLSDIGMPVQDGYALIRAVRSLPTEQGGKIPAVAVTAYASASERAHALEAGFNWHLAKPMETDQLIAIVGHAINRGSRNAHA